MTKPSTPTADRHDAANYEIRLRGHLDARWAERLDVAGLTLEGDGTTVIRANAADQSALHGLLQRLRDLGLPLVSVCRIPGAEDRPALPRSGATPAAPSLPLTHTKDL